MSNDTVCQKTLGVACQLNRLGFPIAKGAVKVICGKPKNPDHLYCPNCENEVYDETLSTERISQQ